MDNQSRLKRLYFNVKLSGWLGVFPAVAALQLYKGSGELLYIVAALITAVTSLYVLITSDSDSWQQRSKVLTMIAVTIFLAGVLPAIPLILASKYTND